MIIDGHAHFLNHNVIKDRVKDPKFLENFQNPSVEEGKKFWLEAMDKNAVEKTVFMALSPGNTDFMNFINGSERFIGTTNVNPVQENAVELLDEDIKAGCKGLKLYATTGDFDIHSKKADEVYEYCAKNNIPITIHFGVTIGRTTDLMKGHPLTLSPVITKFPDVKFVIAHFGAGFLKEALLLTYKNENVCFDTSGTNNWLDVSPFDWTLKDVFRHSLKAVGSERIVFGTDTHRFSEGYRAQIIEDQKHIVSELEGDRGVENIFYKNAKRVWGI